uniref:Uncharacterized protein n=1 Tax=Aegilops tauschii TaxID=37682 RepID=M8B2D8_AEGTA
MEGSDEESQAPAAPGPLPLPPPGPLPPPATDEGHLELLGVLRLRVRGLAPWMLPPYFLFNVDIYNYHPRELLAAYPSATAADGSSALYFVNLVRPKTATDSRKKRAVPGGTWKSERSPLPLVSEAIQGARQTFSFTVLGAKGEEIRQGYIMQELTLAGDEGKLDGGADMAVSKIYPSPRGDKAKRKAKPDFLPQNILRASEVIGRRRVPVDCDDVVLLQKKKKLPAVMFDALAVMFNDGDSRIDIFVHEYMTHSCGY